MQEQFPSMQVIELPLESRQASKAEQSCSGGTSAAPQPTNIASPTFSRRNRIIVLNNSPASVRAQGRLRNVTIPSRIRTPAPTFRYVVADTEQDAQEVFFRPLRAPG